MSLRNLFKKKSEEEKISLEKENFFKTLSEEEKQQLAGIEKVKRYIYNVEKFEGDKKEYEEYKGVKYKILGPSVVLLKEVYDWYWTEYKFCDDSRKMRWFYESKRFQNLKSLCDEGIEAILHSHETKSGYSGLPVKKK